VSSEDLADFWIHTVSVETYQGTTGAGAKAYAAAVTVPCFLSRKLRFVRNANGEQVASQASLSADASWAATLAAQSRVTVDGRPTTIIATAVLMGGDFIEGLDRVKVYLQ
jgi:hypothetical protein